MIELTRTQLLVMAQSATFGIGPFEPANLLNDVCMWQILSQKSIETGRGPGFRCVDAILCEVD
jgi:hypothetical protein